jgi:intracellular sulfur oxidation DsrE/DsrF family protein
MKKIFLFLALLGFLQADDQVARVVFDLTTSNLDKFERNILKGIAAHKNHYESNLKELEVAVVIHGDAYKFFVKDIAHSPFKEDKELVKVYDDFKTRIQTMSDTYNVEFLMCKAAMPKNKLEEKDIVSFVKMVPNSTIGLIEKQNHGYAYIPVNNN